MTDETERKEVKGWLRNERGSDGEEIVTDGGDKGGGDGDSGDRGDDGVGDRDGKTRIDLASLNRTEEKTLEV